MDSRNTAKSLVEECRRHGGFVYLRGDAAAIKGAVPEQLVNRMRQNREAIIAFLRAESAPEWEWWKAPLKDWQAGKLVIRNIARDETVVINLRDAEARGNA
jgi:hypothetical protein